MATGAFAVLKHQLTMLENRSQYARRKRGATAMGKANEIRSKAEARFDRRSPRGSPRMSAKMKRTYNVPATRSTTKTGAGRYAS